VGRRRALVGLALALVVLSACDAPTRPDHDVRVTSVALTAAVHADGKVSMSSAVTFPDGEGGPFAIAAPTLGSLDDIRVDGNPRRDSGGEADLDPQGAASTVTWVVEGAVERYGDGAIVTIPVWSEARSATGDDARVPFHAEVTLPAAPVGSVHWHGASPAVATVAGTTVTLDGELGATTASELTFVLPADSVPTAAVVAGTTRVAAFQERQASGDAADAHIAEQLRNDADREDLEAALYWIAVAVEVAIPFLVTFGVAIRTAYVRRRAAAGVPDELDDPPSARRAALVSLLEAEGQDIGGEAIAGTLLELAQRGAISVEGVTSERYLLRTTGSGRSAAENELLGALRGAATADGAVAGPPLPLAADGTWWRTLRQEAVIDARNARLLRRRYPSVLFLASVFALTITTIPLYAKTPELLVAGFVDAAILSAIPFVGGYVLTKAGLEERARWRAYRSHLQNQAELGDVGAPGVVVWGPHLVYAAALGIATTAVRDLTPAGTQPKEPVSP
jgi:hypothetical protein